MHLILNLPQKPEYLEVSSAEEEFYKYPSKGVLLVAGVWCGVPFFVFVLCYFCVCVLGESCLISLFWFGFFCVFCLFACFLMKHKGMCFF